MIQNIHSVRLQVFIVQYLPMIARAYIVSKTWKRGKIIHINKNIFKKQHCNKKKHIKHRSSSNM